MDKTSEINTPDGRCASEIIVSLQRARKNLRIYPSNNPIYIRTLEETYKKTMAFFEFGNELELKISRNEFLLGDEVVYSGTDSEENLALFFFRDGLRSITFKDDLTQDELLRFLSAVAVDLDREGVEEDLVTLLWEKDFMSIKYKVDDSVLVENEDFQKDSEEKVKENPTEEGVMQEAQAELAEEEEVVPLVPMPISDEDLKTLALDVEAYGKDTLEKLTDVLFDMFYVSENLDELKDVVRIMQNAVEYAAQNDDLAGALTIFRRVKEVMQKTNSDNVKDALSEVLHSAGSRSLMRIIGTRLDSKEGLKDEDFKEYVSVLNKNAIPQMVEVLGNLQSIQGRKKLINALTFVGKKDIAQLAKFLGDTRWFVVRNIVLILRETKDKRAVDYIVKAMGHKEPRVRREAIKGISELGSVKHSDRLVEMLQDNDRTVNIAAASALGKLRNRTGLEALVTRITDKDLMEEDPSLIKKYFEAMSYFQYDDVVDFLEGVLKKNPFFGRAAYNEMKANAIYCLGLLGDARAMDLLEELSGSKVKQIADYSATAIKRIKHASKG